MFTIPTLFSFVSLVNILVGVFLFCLYLLPYCYCWMGSNYALLITTILIIYTNFLLFIAIIVIYYLVPETYIDSILIDGTKWFRTLFKERIERIESNIRKTFQIKALYPLPKRAIRSFHPHGMSAAAPTIHSMLNITDPLVPHAKGVCHYLFFYLPVIRDILRVNHVSPSDYESMKRIIQTESVTTTLGGVDEMRRLKHKQFELVISKRKGMFRMALETGTPIVPVLTYGENELFPEIENTVIKDINTFLYNNYRVRSPYPTLQSITNWYNLMNRPLDPVKTYLGNPIYVKKIENPSEKHIVKLRNIYIQRMKDLFAETNDGTYTLEIL